MATEYGKRLKAARKHAKLTQIQLSEKTGIPQSTISTAENFGHGSADTTTYATACGVNSHWLATGEGEMEITPAYMEGHANIRFSGAGNLTVVAPIELEGNPDYPAVRRVSVKAQAGITGYAVENCEDGAPIVFRADWYRTHNYRPERLMALRVAGESMVPSLYPDDLIVVNTESTTPRDGVAFLVAYYGEVMVKRLVMDAGQWWLNSDNSDQRRHPRKLCDESTVLIGEVVYKQSERV